MKKLCFLRLVLSFLMVLSPVSSAASAETRQEGDWFYPSIRGVKQEGLEHRVCAIDIEEIVLCFEFLWDRGYLTLWIQVSTPDGADWRFRDDYASDFRIDGKIHGSTFRGETTGSTNSMLDADRFLGADRSQYYHYGGDWLFFQEVVAPPPIYDSNPKNLYYKLIHARHLRLVHYLDDGSTFETEYDLDGLAVLLTAAFEEAAAMEHKFGRKPAAE